MLGMQVWGDSIGNQEDSVLPQHSFVLHLTILHRQQMCPSIASEGYAAQPQHAGSNPGFGHEESQSHIPPRKWSQVLSRCWFYQQLDSILMATFLIKLQCREGGMCTCGHLHVLRAYKPG